MRIERRWQDLTDEVSAFAGDCVIHADLNGGNVLIGRDRPYVVDWGFVSRGAAWIEVAILVQWLIRDGHTPGEAEVWANQFPAWAGAPHQAITLFSEVNAMRWQQIIANNPAPWASELADITQRWATYRKGSDPHDRPPPTSPRH